MTSPFMNNCTLCQLSQSDRQLLPTDSLPAVATLPQIKNKLPVQTDDIKPMFAGRWPGNWLMHCGLDSGLDLRHNTLPMVRKANVTATQIALK